ncbi:prenyltransferase/squalene oxidase repeat-containing protein [Amycolatopsis sp. A133]|uniref:prenyltransferase/squalene oxidase repeat-containing protein n=1 Tax=Amycolatopsis sp. A133 TaxID=3064472 RepID=UPI0027FC6D30|nr:prenyltransferase/squalene oxidase repeat-containing protein [Amycolatopsis sp. A133]MDQ7807610.1 prenyltransferase/squalene oxidase repeat-containing protein [Amycolatopsis sp. A133]
MNKPVIAAQATDPGAADAATKAIEYLYARQRADGAWTDRLSSSTVSTALGLLSLDRADRQAHRDRIARGIDWLKRNQRADGGWSMADDNPPSSPGMTSFAIAALYGLDREGSAGLIERGKQFIDGNGGYTVIPGMRDKGPKTWPAAAPIAWSLVGLKDVSEQPPQAVEAILLPAWLRNKVSIALPAILALGIMQARARTSSLPRRLLQRVAEPKALAWLRSALGPNGGVEECAMLSALIFLGLHSAGVGEDIQQASLKYLLDNQREDGSWPIDRDLEIAVTCYTVLALAEFGDTADEPRLRPTRDFLLSTQWTEPFTPLGIPAGGWSWNVPSGWPESEDTAVVLSTLKLLGLDNTHPAVAQGLRWLHSRQNRDGSWSEWVRNSSLLNDKPCVGVTAHVIMALDQHGDPRGPRTPIGKALRYFRRVQHPDGASPSLWFRDSVHGTAKLLETYAELGAASDPAAVRAREWLLANQRPDGAWPLTVEVGVEGGTAEETGWAVYSLLRAGVPATDDAIVRGVKWLVDNQNADGTWTPSPVGLYFEDLCYNDDLIAHAYALRALGRWLKCVGHPDTPA